MPKVVIYHNPRCSKSCLALEILQQHNLSVEIIDYVQTPPSIATIQQLLAKLNMTPRQLMRSQESMYQQLKLDKPQLTDTQLIQAMHQHPILIERPIVILDNNALIARPPEKITELL